MDALTKSVLLVALIAAVAGCTPGQGFDPIAWVVTPFAWFVIVLAVVAGWGVYRWVQRRHGQ